MNPTRTKTSVGMETVAETVKRAQALVPSVETAPKLGQPTVAPRLNPTIPQVIPSTALAGSKTFEDVMDTRADLETQATAKQQLTDRIKGTTDRIGANTPMSFNDPDSIINRLALNRVPTETENQRKQAFDTAQQNRRDYAGDIATARTEANAQFGVPDLVARKAEVTQQYAEREAQMDADIKRLEENATKRGVARQYVDAEKQKIKSDALEDLSNYAAIEAAISGSITEARTIINDTINDKKAAFELENQAIQQEIDYLSTLAGEENQREASQLQFALNERKAAQDKQLAMETEIKTYAAEVAAEGADDGTIQAILKSGTAEEALRYAAPYLGRTQRMQAQASMAQGWARIGLDREKLLLDRAAAGDKDAARQLGLSTEPDEQEYQIKTADIQMGIGAAQSFLKNAEGIKLATGAFQSPFMAATAQAIGGGTAGGALAGSVVPGIGTVLGGVAGALAGVAATPFYYSRTKTAKDEALAAASFLVNDTTFQEIRDLRASGVTFGNMTEGERIAAGRAAQQLNSAAIVDESGTVSGFRGSPETIKQYVNDILVAYQGRQEFLDRQKTISQDDESEALSVWNQN